MDCQPTEQQPFLPEWVTEIFYGGVWHKVLTGTFQRIKTEYGVTYLYLDPYSDDSVFVATEIQGYRFRKPDASSANVIDISKR